MRQALEALPWVRRVEVDFERKQATVTAVKDKLDTAALEAALEKAGFGGKVVPRDEPPERKRSSAGKKGGTSEPPGEAKEPDPVSGRAKRTVVLHVTGMMKSKSGAT